MQIIINRIAIIAERRPTALKLKIATAVIISCINIAVFCIFIPSHMVPPVNQTFVAINKYWDRLSKILIMLVDAYLNWYFVYVVRARLVKFHGLRKYQSLVNYYTRLGIVSVAMDVSFDHDSNQLRATTLLMFFRSCSLVSCPSAITSSSSNSILLLVRLNNTSPNARIH